MCISVFGVILWWVFKICFLVLVNWDFCVGLLCLGAVQKLVEDGIPLETENKEKETACDCAEKNGHSDIALFLESKMVFSLVCFSAGND